MSSNKELRRQRRRTTSLVVAKRRAQWRVVNGDIHRTEGKFRMTNPFTCGIRHCGACANPRVWGERTLAERSEIEVFAQMLDEIDE